MIKINFVNKSPNNHPNYSDSKASGFDLRAWITEEESEDSMFGNTIVLQPFERRLINTGIYVELPEGVEIQVRPKSGQALKKGITVLNTPGTVDNNYRGEIKVIIINLSNKSITIENGEKIAQAVVCPVFVGENVELNPVFEISLDTERGTGGFGHNGIK